MIAIPGYQIIEQLYESASSLVYRACREHDNLPVILKILKKDYPSPEAIARYKLEYEITEILQMEGVIKTYGLAKYQNTIFIILEDFGGKSLRQLMSIKKFSLTYFLKLAIRLADIISRIHGANIMHKDINPSNIILNLNTGEIKIIDFGIAAPISQENITLLNPVVLEGTLAYMSPEQTGRMNREIDYRTDFYSLGATFYELLTQKPPFETVDAIELVHSHLAKKPVPPHEHIRQIPHIVSEIVLKLLAKTAEERYQSANGLKADLERCLLQLKTFGKIQPFLLAQKDISDKFQIPQKLYGREAEISALIAAFERVSQGQTEMMLVGGYSGIGKSALVQELYQAITKHRGYFIAGKFDQLQRNTPYASVIQAFQELIRHLLTENEIQIGNWRKKLQAALGSNGQVITDVIPEVELIIGSQDAIAELSPAESQNRFNLVFQNFIQVFTQPEHPLVIFLDDLQWADSASLNLLQILLSKTESQHLFLIGAYRDNEVYPAHPLILTLEALKKKNAAINTIFLSPLSLTYVTQLIADTLSCSLEKVVSLAELVYQKTNGNPFFIKEFLKSLYSDGFLKFEFSHLNPSPREQNLGNWQWDLDAIQTIPLSENVVELMLVKIQKLPEFTQSLLKLAACVGNLCDLKTLSIISRHSLIETANQLAPAIEKGLIIPLGNDYKILKTSEHPGNLKIIYKFLHDRVQQAAYELIPSEQKAQLHLSIGELLLKNTPRNLREEKVFDIVNQINLGSNLVTQPEQRNEFAELNLIAGKKAKSSAAYELAFSYLKAGLNILGNLSWETQYQLSLSLYVEAAEAAYLCTNFAEMESLAEVVLDRAKNLLDKVKVHEVKIQALIAQNKLKEAIKDAQIILKELGIFLPEFPKNKDILLGLLKTKIRLINQRVDRLSELPEMKQADKLAAMNILAKIVSAAYNSLPELLPLIAFQQVSLSVSYGNAVVSPFGYATYGFILCGVVGDIETGYQFGQLALKLLEQFNAKNLKARTLLIINGLIRHWKEHIKETLQPFLTAYQIGLETGDFEFAAFSAHIYSYHSYFIGKPLVELEREMGIYNSAIAQLKQKTVLNFNQIFQQAVLNLMVESENPTQLKGKVYDEDKMLPLHLHANDVTALCDLYINKLILLYLFEDYSLAVKNAELTAEYLEGVTATILVPIFYFYHSLSLLAVYANCSKTEQKQIILQVNEHQKKLKNWAKYAPMNYLHKFYLVEAEKQRILGQNAKAIELYDQAIDLAKEYEYLNEEAIAQELAAKFYLSQGKIKVAKVYFLDAHYCYLKWGAIAKVKDLEKKYPQLLARNVESLSLQNFYTTIVSLPTITGSGRKLDLTTFMKASQALSSEIVLDKLLVTLMKIMIENAGAQKGFLILNSAGKLLIQAEGSVENDNIVVMQPIPLDSPEATLRLPTAIIHYVARTKQSVFLNDLLSEVKFNKDPYILQNQPKSIMCTPLVNQGKLSGIVYLEHNLVKDAFTVERLEILKLLSCQTAIAIENAQLYRNLQKSLDAELELTNAYGRFVPHEFLYFLGYETIIDVKLGDAVQQEMSVLFADIRDFTKLSENMTPEDNFKFINAYLSRMEPAILENNGFIDKYIGDEVMALFSGGADDAVRAGIAMLHRLSEYNTTRQRPGRPPFSIGIGINTGSLMLGTVGGLNRMDGTVISDAVNLASRIERLTKEYGVSLLISHHTFEQLENPSEYLIRTIDRVVVKGKSEAVTVYEVCNGDAPEVQAGKRLTLNIFTQGLSLYKQQKFPEAKELFFACMQQNPGDQVAQIYLERCDRALNEKT